MTDLTWFILVLGGGLSLGCLLNRAMAPGGTVAEAITAELQEETARMRAETEAMQQEQPLRGRELTLALQRTAANLEANNMRLAAQLAAMKADRTLKESIAKIRASNDNGESSLARIRAANDRIVAKLLRAQDIDLDAPAQAAGRWVGRGWSGEVQ